LRKGGRIVGFHGNSRDITERVRAEKALRESEARYRMILESIEDGYYEIDLKGCFTFFNDALCRIYQYSREELMGMNIRTLTDPETSRKGTEVFKTVFATGVPSRRFEWQAFRKDGSERCLSASVSLIRDPEGRPSGFRGMVRDVTESRRLQSQLQQAGKMEAVATLAGGIAHQFNNALTPIIGNIGLLEMDYAEDGDLMKCLRDMKSAGWHMAHLTNQLLAYARGGKYKPVVVSLVDVVSETLPLVRHTLNPGVRIETDLPQGLWKVRADPTQMQMVVSAILTNANEAISGPGRISIAARYVRLDEAFAAEHSGVEPGPYVCLCISDDGRGMSEETRKRIFEPFFTTHFIGRGLGMPAAYGIVVNHNGIITVDSALGKGTRVCVYLPAILENSLPSGESA